MSFACIVTTVAALGAWAAVAALHFYNQKLVIALKQRITAQQALIDLQRTQGWMDMQQGQEWMEDQ